MKKILNSVPIPTNTYYMKISNIQFLLFLDSFSSHVYQKCQNIENLPIENTNKIKFATEN